MATSFATLFDAEFEQEEAERMERLKFVAKEAVERHRRRQMLRDDELRPIPDFRQPARLELMPIEQMARHGLLA